MAEENPYSYGVPLKCEGNVLICNILPKVHVLGINKAFLRLSDTHPPSPFLYVQINAICEGMVVAWGGVEDEAPSTPTIGEGSASP